MCARDACPTPLGLLSINDLLPESGNTNQITEQPIIAFPAYVTSRHSGMCNAGTNEKWRSEHNNLPLKAYCDGLFYPLGLTEARKWLLVTCDFCGSAVFAVLSSGYHRMPTVYHVKLVCNTSR